MGRTRLRGIELAGMRIAVEAPHSHRWDWSTEGLGQMACSPSDPDVYVGVSVGSKSIPDWDPVTYSFEAGTFDIGRVEEDWLIAVHGRGRRYERVASFDADFSVGEVVMSPAAVAAGVRPLDGPLLDLILLHRIVAERGLVVAGTAVVRQGRALAFLGPEGGRGQALPDVGRSGSRRPLVSPQAEQDPGRSDVEPGAGELRTCSGRFALRLDGEGVMLHALPDNGEETPVRFSARLDAIHVVSSSSAVFARPLPHAAATTEILQHVFAPVHDPDCTEQLLTLASAICSRVPVLELGLPEERRVVPFAWGKRQAALAFANPALG